VTIESKKSPKGLDDHQKGDSSTPDRAKRQSTLVIEVQGAGHQIMVERTQEVEQKTGAEEEEGWTAAPAEKEKTGGKKIVAEKEKEIIFCGMMDVIPIKVKEERVEEARGQNPQKDETLADGGLTSDRGRRQLGCGEVTKVTPAQEGAFFCRCCEQWQGESVLAGSEQIVRVQVEEAQIARVLSEEAQPPLRIEVQERGVTERCQWIDVLLTDLAARVLRGRRRAARARTERERGHLNLEGPRTLVEVGTAGTA
jgi:hypothetical protein